MNVKFAMALASLNALVSAAFLVAYAVWFAPPSPPRLAILDVAELYRLKETQVAAVIVRRDATDEDRLGALKRAHAFGAEMTAMIQALPEECRCLIFARGALVSHDSVLPDLTPEVRRRLGL